MAKMNLCLNFIVLATFLQGTVWSAPLSFVCPSDGIFPNPENCKTYYLCSGLIPSLMSCSDKELFDPVINNCNWADQVKCTVGSTSTSTTSTTVAPSTTNTPPPTPSLPTSTEETPPTNSPNVPNCPKQGQAVFADASDCTSFFMCSEGAYFPSKCPPGYGFNSVELTCVIGNNDCQEDGPQSTTPTPNAPVCPATGQERVPNTASCTTFYICIEGEAALITCPVNYQFDEKAGKCNEAASDTCGDFVTPSPIQKLCEEKPDGFLLPDPLDCSKFYQCSHGNAISIDCPEGLQFSADKNACVKPNIAQCSV